MDVSDCDQPIHMKHIHQNTESFLQDNFVINNFIIITEWNWFTILTVVLKYLLMNLLIQHK